MSSPELILITLNLIIVMYSYFILYPKIVKNDIKKLSSYDLLSSIISLIGASAVYFGTGEKFNLLITDVNWFWFSIITYIIIELPFVFWYSKKYYISITDTLE
jgi:hypothetical protein